MNTRGCIFQRFHSSSPPSATCCKARGGWSGSTAINQRRQWRDAYVIGSGPNGLTAAIVLARAGLHTTVLEAEPVIGGGARSAELTLPGFHHDVGSAVHPLAAASPAFASFPLAQHGLEWIQPSIPVAHPMEDGYAGVLCRSLESTCERLGPDGRAYQRVVLPFVRRWPELVREILQPPHLPSDPWFLARFGYRAVWPAATTARRLFRTQLACALFAGVAAHSILPLESLGSAAFGWVLSIAAHAVGWPIPKGGAQQISNALSSYFESLGGQIIVNTRISSLRDLDRSALLLFDLTPRPFLNIAGNELPKGYRRALSKYRYGPGVFKMDWALREPIPWEARDCNQAGTVHVGGTLEEVASAERETAKGKIVERPFVLLAQPTRFDPTRAPAGRHIAWGYCHVPNGSDADMTVAIESQIERFAPGFRQRILARHSLSPAALERWNANLVGGDITGGAQNLGQLLIRPTRRLYRTPLENVYLCSSATPPGGGVHGMCGYWAAHTALGDAGIRAVLPAGAPAEGNYTRR